DLDKRNFRRKMLNSGILLPLTEKQLGVSNKPARFYSYNRSIMEGSESQYINLRMEGTFTLFQ
ncbi:MAG: hypothetical protein EBV19_10820, partial [Flavobacteriia bacterium]|nr:hypothetical protein [Flavobacteriia bacterium]